MHTNYNLHNDHKIKTQVTFVACGAHPLFVIALNFMNFLLVGLIVEVRFLGLLVKKKKEPTPKIDFRTNKRFPGV